MKYVKGPLWSKVSLYGTAPSFISNATVRKTLESVNGSELTHICEGLFSKNKKVANANIKKTEMCLIILL